MQNFGFYRHFPQVRGLWINGRDCGATIVVIETAIAVLETVVDSSAHFTKTIILSPNSFPLGICNA